MIVDIDLNPTKGSETGKIRPCVIVTNNQYNSKVPVIQVVPMTILQWAQSVCLNHIIQMIFYQIIKSIWKHDQSIFDTVSIANGYAFTK